jgi:hypothetical protein
MSGGGFEKDEWLTAGFPCMSCKKIYKTEHYIWSFTNKSILMLSVIYKVNKVITLKIQGYKKEG